MFSSFATLNWAINTIQACLSNAHTIVLVRDRKNSIFINNSAMFLEIISAVLIAIFLFLFSNQITYVYNLENDARNILSIILKLKAIQLPILAMSYVPKNILKVNEKTSKIWIAVIVSCTVNIIGDLLSIKFGFNEVGIYVVTIISSLINLTLLIIFSKYKIFKATISYIKQIIFYAKDLIFNKFIQRIVNIYYTSVASSFGTNIYAIHCVCSTIIETLLETSEGLYSGLLVDYVNDLDKKTPNLLKKVDTIDLYCIIFGMISIPFLLYPLWFLLGKSIPWISCNPYIWLYSIEFVATMASCNYRAYLSANKDTKSISMVAFVGGICVRVPICYFIYKYHIGLIGIALACSIDKIVRVIYLRTYIKVKHI